MNLKRLVSYFLCAATFLAGCNPCPASTVTGTLLDNQGLPYVGPFQVSPKSNPGVVGTGTIVGKSFTTNTASDGTFSFYLVTGNYALRIDKLYEIDFPVPAGTGTNDISVLATNLIVFSYTNGALISQSRVLATDTTSDYLGKKIVAGTNIVLTTNNPTGNSTLQINAQAAVGTVTAGSGIVTTTNGSAVTVGTSAVTTNDARVLNFGNAANTFAGTHTGTFSGNGSNVTHLQAVNLEGTIASANLPANLVTTNGGNQTIYQMPAFQNGATFPDLSSIALGSFGSSLFINSAHSGSGEIQLSSGGRIAFAPAYGAGLIGALQFGASSFGSFDGSRALFYSHTSTFSDATHPLGYGYTWMELGNYYQNGAAVGVNSSHRTEGVNTNGAGRTIYAYGTFAGTSTLNQGPVPGELLGVPSFSIDLSTNGLDSGITSYGHITKAATNISPSLTNYGVDFGGPTKVYLTLSTNLNLTNVALRVGRTNNGDDVNLFVIPGTSPYAVTTPTNWNWESESGTGVAPTNVPASKMLHIKVSQDVTSGGTNYVAHSGLIPYTPVYDVDAVKFFAATAGALSALETNVVNTRFLAAKAHGCFANYVGKYLLVGGTSNSCKWNMANTNNFPLTWFGQVTSNFTAQGVWGTPANSFYADSGIVPGSALSSPNSSYCAVCIRGPANPVDIGVFYGITDNSNMRWLASRSGTSFNFDGMNVTTAHTIQQPSGGNFIGTMGQNRYGASTQRQYFNSAVAPGGDYTGTVVSLPSGTGMSVYFWNVNFKGSPGTGYSDANMTVLTIAQNMTLQNVLDDIADDAAMNTALGR